MNDKAAPSNRHPVDQLAEVREFIKTYQKKEGVLKEKVSTLMNNANSVGGDEYIAILTTSERSGTVDIKAMEEDGIDIKKYRKPKTLIISIRTERRVREV